MKKLLSIAVLGSLFALGCGGTDSGTKSTTSKATMSTTQTTHTSKPETDKEKSNMPPKTENPPAPKGKDKGT